MAFSAPAFASASLASGQDYWSIQIISGKNPNGFARAQAALESFPEMRLEHRGDLLTLRAGLWTSRSEAQKYLQQARRKFPGAYIRVATYRPELVFGNEGLSVEDASKKLAALRTNVGGLETSADSGLADGGQQMKKTKGVAQQSSDEAIVGNFEIQVLARSITVRAQPSDASEILADMPRGQLTLSDRRIGAWYRIPVAGGKNMGWIRLEPGENGDMSISIREPERALTQEMLAKAEDPKDPSILRARPIGRTVEIAQPVIDPAQVLPPQAWLPRETVAVPDRWRLMQALDFKFPLYDPYNQNPLKGDLPVLDKYLGPGWFFNLGVISDTLFEARRLPTPVAPQTSSRSGSNDLFGQGKSSTFAQNLILSFGLIKGDTTFRPPDYEFRFVPVINYNRSQTNEVRTLRVDPRSGESRTDNFLGVQELFADVHLRNVSERYDFDSVRVGIQPFTSDFRGFLFQDVALGVRFFGNRDNNQWQYNTGWLRRLEKDSNSGLNAVGKKLRNDDVFFANAYHQDFPMLGFTSQAEVIYNRNREAGPDYYDTNGNLIRPAVLGDVRPHNYDVGYFGYSGDGHFGRYAVSTSTYLALGHDTRNPLAQRSQQIRAFFHATEVSRDFDWIRLRGNFLYASGDKNPFDNKSTGFDAILENPQFAGADTSFFIRQGVPLLGGGGVALSGRNGVLPSLRSSKDQGQSNFVNPGLTLLGVGADFDITPKLRILSNISYLRFNETEVLGVLRNQGAPSSELGTDVSAGFQYRPRYSQNIVVNGSIAALLPGKGLRQLYDEGKRGPQYSALLNMLLTF